MPSQSYSVDYVIRVLRSVFSSNEIDATERVRVDASGQQLKRLTVRNVDATQFSILESKLRARLSGAPLIARPSPFGSADRDAMVIDVYFREKTASAATLERVSALLGLLAIGFAALGAARCA